MSMNVVSE